MMDYDETITGRRRSGHYEVLIQHGGTLTPVALVTRTLRFEAGRFPLLPVAQQPAARCRESSPGRRNFSESVVAAVTRPCLLLRGQVAQVVALGRRH